jgi:hypothetical protein
VGKREQQYQCADQSCDCYGKLLCSACVVSLNQTQQQTSGDATVAALLVGAVAGGATLFAAPLVVAAGVGVGAIVTASAGLRALGFNVWGSSDKKDDYQYPRLCCVQCRHPVKHLR